MTDKCPGCPPGYGCPECSDWTIADLRGERDSLVGVVKSNNNEANRQADKIVELRAKLQAAEQERDRFASRYDALESHIQETTDDPPDGCQCVACAILDERDEAQSKLAAAEQREGELGQVAADCAKFLTEVWHSNTAEGMPVEQRIELKRVRGNTYDALAKATGGDDV